MLCCRTGELREAVRGVGYFAGKSACAVGRSMPRRPDAGALSIEEMPVLSCFRFRRVGAESAFVPRPPRRTNHRAWWTLMLLKWFFELGDNPAFYDSDSPQSRDIADSYSMSMVIAEYLSEGRVPDSWIFKGPDTAAGVYGEVEWFIGSYAISDFRLEDGMAEFLVLNKSGWRSGTRLPVTWQWAVQHRTSRTLTEFIGDAPRGGVLKSKVLSNFPWTTGVPGAMRVLDHLPSFGGDWEQIYRVRMPWPEAPGMEAAADAGR